VTGAPAEGSAAGATPQQARERALRRWAHLLGLGGLIPFAFLALVAVAGDPDHARMALLAQTQYAVAILSFIGALHWGVALAGHGMSASRTRAALVWSVVPSLYAFFATIAPELVAEPAVGPAHATLLLLAIGFVGAWVVDRRMYRGHPVPAWFTRLRGLLTAGATASVLLTTLFG
jgi:hypothetical protein